MKKLILSSLACSLLFFSNSCDKSSTGNGGAKGGVAIVDMDRVVSTMGWSDQIRKSIQEANQGLKHQLDERSEQIEHAQAAKRKQLALAAKLSKEQTDQLLTAKDLHAVDTLPLSKEQHDEALRLIHVSNQDLTQARQDAQQAMRERQGAIVASYRDMVRPVAGHVATANGFSLVLVPTPDTVLFSDPSADLTDRVIDELRQSAAAPLPSLDLPPLTGIPGLEGATQPATQPTTAATTQTATERGATQPTTTPGTGPATTGPATTGPGDWSTTPIPQ